MVNKCINFILNALYPHRCLLCGGEGFMHRDLCQGCYRDLPWNRHPCPACALPLPPETTAGQLCGTCTRKPPVPFRILAPFLYLDPVTHLIAGFKFQGRLDYGRLLGQLFCEWIAHQELPAQGVMVPIPLHRQRIRERGFNQSLELARHIRRRQPQLAVQHTLIKRTHVTQPQTQLELAERRRNVRGCFTLADVLPGSSLILLDDVVTTGATVREAARVLLRAGARRDRIEAWALARTPRGL